MNREFPSWEFPIGPDVTRDAPIYAQACAASGTGADEGEELAAIPRSALGSFGALGLRSAVGFLAAACAVAFADGLSARRILPSK
jgi:hypothetical protein